MQPVPHLLALVALLAAACGSHPGQGDRPTVVATVYPLAEIAGEVAGGRVQVVELVPPGVEPHDLELTAGDLTLLQSADLVLYLGGGFQPAVERSVPEGPGALDLLAWDGDPEDPHVWLDPRKMHHLARGVAKHIAGILGVDGSALTGPVGRYLRTLERLHEDYRSTLAVCERRVFVTAHDAFGHLAARYDLEQHAIAGLSPDSEPTPGRLVELRRLVRTEGITTVFAETLASTRVAETLAREAGVTVEVLDPLENLTAEQRAAGASYDSVMRENLTKLARALGCGRS